MKRPAIHAPLVWPDALELPKKPPWLVYLDLNHWIGLAKVAKSQNKTDDPYSNLLEACRAALHLEKARFVLTDILYQEIWKISDPRQRKDLAVVIEELSNFDAILGRATILKLELQATAKKMFPLEVNYLPTPLLGRGIFHAFGLNGGMKFVSKNGEDKSDELRRKMGDLQFGKFKITNDLMLQREMLRGPEDSQIEALRLHGYSPEKAWEIVTNRRDKERHIKEQLNIRGAHWRKERLYDVMAANEVAHELLDSINSLAIAHPRSPLDLFGKNKDSALTFARSMPSTEVAIEVKARYHRNPNKNWETNDINDIDALAVAMSYCDIVFTDNEARDALLIAKLDSRLKTKVPKTPAELTDLLISL